MIRHAPTIGLLLVLLASAAMAEAPSSRLLPEPAPTPFEQRRTPYSMVYYYLSPDAEQTRWLVGSLRDLGVTHAQALIYWWKAETLGGDYWRADYRPEVIGDGFNRALDLFVETCHEMGVQPAFRLGSRGYKADRWHPADPTDSIEPYADWVGRIAARYRGKVHHYVIGDEEHKAIRGFGGSPQRYLDEFLKPMSDAIRAGDPNAMVSGSSSRMEWNLRLIDAGAPQYADGLATNLPHRHWELREEVAAYMREARRRWPDVKFFANGVVYAENRHGPRDPLQAARIAQGMFTAWRMGWDNAPYYLYRFGQTADTRQNFGIVKFPTDDEPAVFSDAWYALQTIAHTFYNRNQLEPPTFDIELTAAMRLPLPGGDSGASGGAGGSGGTIGVAPPDPQVHAFIRDDRQLLIYLAYDNLRNPQRGRWHIALHTADWGGPQQIPLLDYKVRNDVPSRREADCLVIENVEIGIEPTILTLRRVADAGR